MTCLSRLGRHHLESFLPSSGLAEHVFRPTAGYAAAQRVSFQAKSVGQIVNLNPLAPINQNARPPRVSLLHCGRRPSAIFRGIITVHVDAIKRQALRTFAHIGQEVRESIPPITNVNSPATVVGIASVLRIAAAPAHLLPGMVGRRLIKTVRPARALTPATGGAIAAAATLNRRWFEVSNRPAAVLALHRLFHAENREKDNTGIVS